MTVDYVKILEDHRINLYPEFLEKPKDAYDDAYFADIKNKNTLIITAGDSWTWGGSLDPDKRLDQVYGRLLSSHIDADWINIGCSGWSNSWILSNLDRLLEKIEFDLYNKILIIVTLTEAGRDIASYSSFKYDYRTRFEVDGVHENTYEKVLSDAESQWAEQLEKISEKIKKNTNILVGFNFVWFDHLYLHFLNHKKIRLLDKSWIEKLAEYQNISMPHRAKVVVGFTLDQHLPKINEIAGIHDLTEFKKWHLKYVDLALKINDWYDKSPINAKSGTRHPIAEGHRVWADYILENLKGNS